MTDFVDQTLEREEKLLAMSIQDAVQTRRDDKGPLTCPECMAPNDRAMEGYRICSACFEEARDGQKDTQAL